ncbi:hypothetical protein [Spiroplasma endosymbiont of Crioceris asparagi]|uniref:hypothetical protein n=1 Tax=Spiroplasma endosymbiont of Crioceris asparagi TaxID=3066286 RepID=UPI0030CB62B6
MAKIVKSLGLFFLGMMLAPKRGVEIRADFVDYLKKYKPQLKKLIENIDEVWEKSNSGKNDEISSEIEMKINEIKELEEELDIVKTKELAYKIVEKLANKSLKISKDLAKSENMKLVTKDLALMSVNIIDKASDVYNKSKTISEKVTEDLATKSDQEKEKE